MKAMSVIPGHRGSALIAESPDPPPTERSVLADPPWLGALISRRVPLSEWPQALTRQPGDVKVAVDLTK
jgi:hypothetical protein